MTDHFRDDEERNRFELDVEGSTAFGNPPARSRWSIR